ncbi:hypothetical protein V4U86_21085 [Mycobacterium sp. AMU20-3851]|uniref:hypothetical protein n=1 Tax=Mycobacterium sp. AMU20-3851 TaxID=3122055 RepID=UPI003754D3A9
MHVSARSYLTAGVAFVGAGAIALTPIQPITPGLQQVAAPAPVVISSTEVELAALVNPIVLWAEALGNTAGNVGSLATTVFQDPAPILEAFIRNQIAAGSTLVDVLVPVARDLITGLTKVPQATIAAVRTILSGQIFQGVGELALVPLSPIIGAMFPLLLGGGLDKITAILQNPFENISRVIGKIVSPMTLVQVGLPLLTDLMAPILQIGATAQAIFDGLKTRNLEAVINAIISFPSDMFNTILNGSSNPMIGNGGLLGPNGLLAGLLGLRKGIADVIEPAPATPQHPPAPLALVAAGSFAEASAPSANDLPGDAADVVTVNLSLDAGPEPDGAVETAVEVEEVTDEVLEDEVTEDEVSEDEVIDDEDVASEEEAVDELTSDDEAEDADAGAPATGSESTSSSTGGDAGNAGDDDAADDDSTDDTSDNSSSGADSSGPSGGEE